MSDAPLTVEEVTYAYDDTWSLGPVNLHVRAGQVLGLIGPNGSGKSTLLRLAAGLLVPRSGRVVLAGRPLAGQPRRQIARRLGFLPQSVQPAYDHRVEEVVAMGRYCHLRGFGWLTDRDRDVIRHCLEQTDLAPLRHRRLSQLSGGQRQRALLASVLAQEPRVLLLDEPTAGLDLHHQGRFFQGLCHLARQGLAVAVVTHDLSLAGQFCDRLVLLRQGRIAAEGDAATVLEASRLVDVYGPDLHVAAHPVNGRPIVLPVRRERP